MKSEKTKRGIAVIGLGYAGLPTALALGKIKKIIGFDVDKKRIDDLKHAYDVHGDFSENEIRKSKINFTNNPNDISKADFYIIIVPTPICEGNIPDFSFLEEASRLVGKNLKKNDIVVYESTVQPGCTETICLPILEAESKLKCGKDFSIGYSPERINPGDKVHTFANTIKVISASDDETLNIIESEYSEVLELGVFRAKSIKVAEASKIIENTQRDVNIALMNEFAMICHRLKISRHDVLETANTKWNFLPFHPGFVGGHCIGIDPYYLIFESIKFGFYPHLIETAREVNEKMPGYITQNTIKHLVRKKLINLRLPILILGITFKENYDDIRNSKAVNLMEELKSYDLEVLFFDPVANKEKTDELYGIKLLSWNEVPQVAAMIITVAHKQFCELTVNDYAKKLSKHGLIIDMKGIISADAKEFVSNDITVWRL